MEPQKQDDEMIGKLVTNWLAIVGSNPIIIIVCVLTLAGCLYTLMTVQSQVDSVNQQWLAWAQKNGCLPQSWDTSVNLSEVLPYYNISIGEHK